MRVEAALSLLLAQVTVKAAGKGLLICVFVRRWAAGLIAVVGDITPLSWRKAECH